VTVQCNTCRAAVISDAQSRTAPMPALAGRWLRLTSRCLAARQEQEFAPSLIAQAEIEGRPPVLEAEGSRDRHRELSLGSERCRRPGRARSSVSPLLGEKAQTDYAPVSGTTVAQVERDPF
jgi:hypothetical protein